jgi:cytochrome b pre-mRNA-processing protein 3
MGIGDLAVPGKMRRVGEAFYGRQVAYRAALAASDPNELVLALRRNVFAGALSPDSTGRLAMYSRQLVHELTGQGGFEQGEISFPDPERLPMQMVAQHE